jgi:large subunit ribosomal protein L23
MKDPRSIVQCAIISEKGTRLRSGSNSYLFQVHSGANKIEIAEAVEKIFSVEVTRVRTMNREGKPKRLGRFAGKRSDWKKAVVTLKTGQTIEVFDQV